MALATEGSYNGKPTLELKWKEDSQYPFSFGVSKANLILASYDAIKAFAEKHKNDKREPKAETLPDGERKPDYGNRQPEY